MRVRTFRWMPLAMVAAVSWGCDDTTAPEVDREFMLGRVNGELVPVTIEEAPGRFRTYVVDIIRLYDDDTWDRYQEWTLDEPFGPDRLITWESDGTLVRDGDELILDFVCNDTPTASCIAPDRLRFTPEGAIIEQPWGSEEGVRLLFFPVVEQLIE